MGGPCDFSVSPSPFGLDFGTLDFGTSDLGLTIMHSTMQAAVEGHEDKFNILIRAGAEPNTHTQMITS